MPRRGAATATTTSPRTRSGDQSPKATASPKAAASPRATASKDVLPSRSSPRGTKRKETEAQVSDGDQTEEVTTPKRGRPKKTETEPAPETLEETETEKEAPATKTTTRGRGRGRRRGRGRGAAASTKGRGKRAKTEETEEAATEEPETEETTKAATSEGEAEKGAIEKEAEEMVEEATTPSKRGRGRGRGGAATLTTRGRGRGRGRGGTTSEAETEEIESKEKADTAKPTTTTRGRKRKTDTATESEETGAQETTEKKSKTDESESVIMEKGRIYFFYRPKVESDRVKDFSDIQRSYILLSPIESQPCQDPEHKHEETPEHVDAPPPATEEGPVTKQQTRHLSARFPHRLILIPRKTLPPTTGGRMRAEFALVDKVSFCIDEIESILEPASYMTKTRGQRHVGGARPAGEGIYELIKHVEVPKSGRKPASHTQLLYTLEVPDHIGEAQRALNIQKSGSIILQVGNPAELPSTGRTDREAPHVSHAGHPLPHHLQQLFKGVRVAQRRFIALDPPELLNYERMKLLMVGDKHGLNEFGEIGEELIAEAEKESEKEREAHHGHPEERIQQEVHLSPKAHPMEPITTGQLV